VSVENQMVKVGNHPATNKEPWSVTRLSEVAAVVVVVVVVVDIAVVAVVGDQRPQAQRSWLCHHLLSLLVIRKA